MVSTLKSMGMDSTEWPWLGVLIRFKERPEIAQGLVLVISLACLLVRA